ncbi:hypothetical protein [Nonomuraea harbinensis]|uniref:Spore-associated protein A n=1 Tax=Nonomuraea harbinensis TaxID=1286938 RepID=A0ABW1C2L3_9ACTN|nr:hypothetical protein [Nonomuraea harbinensis]
MMSRTTAGLVSAALLATALTASPAAAHGGHTPEQVCGPGFGKVANGTRPVTDREGVVWAHVHLLYSARTGENCVVTIKTRHVGVPTWTTATLWVETPDRTYQDKSDYKYYAGPVKAYARNKCVAFEGTTRTGRAGRHVFFDDRASGGSDGYGNCGARAKRRGGG